MDVVRRRRTGFSIRIDYMTRGFSFGIKTSGREYHEKDRACKEPLCEMKNGRKDWTTEPDKVEDAVPVVRIGEDDQTQIFA